MLSNRLKKALRVGDVLGLFPVLKDWPTEELQALLKDADEFSSASCEAIDEAWHKAAFRPAIFLHQEASQELDELRDRKKIEVMAVMSEICSVAFFYLQERGIAVEVPGEEE